MINVLSVISELYFGGGENRLLNFARTIDPARFSLTLATLYSFDRTSAANWGSMHSQFEEAGVKVVDLGLPRPGNRRIRRLARMADTTAILATAVSKLRRLIASMRIDVVDAHLESALYTAVPAAASMTVPAAITLYSEPVLWKMAAAKQPGTDMLRSAVRRFNLRLCGAVFTDSDVRAAELSRFIGRLSPPVQVIPNGVRLGSPRRPRGEILNDFDIPANTQATILGQVAGLVPFKGQAVLLDAAANILKKGADVYVLCIGYPRQGPSYPLQLQDQAAKLGISSRVRIRAYPGDIADVWDAIDIHVHASSIDSLPNAIIEGMSLGKPAVVSSVGGIPDHVENGRTGIVVPPENPVALAEALLRLLGNDGYAKQLGLAAYQRYLQHFTPGNTTAQLERCFDRLVQTHRSRRAVYN